eukprot:gnl/TRDRNA2_/TRDRNA2_184422_c0_seq1.p2 gnl/TRDRNA2_/TRDRNA2_184422_c0~~gnl/TRDRNA2_/TRDRNA2_184422_c0_seq1.p2  ORF type:complete len:125 (+),score=13.31 gnl/TRDRNA2_/TRDRNA2_184422_c0_seq1:75-449(+)
MVASSDRYRGVTTVGCSFRRVLGELHSEAQLSESDVEAALRLFDDAFACELMRVPRFWRFNVKGRLATYQMSFGDVALNLSQARVHSKGASFYRARGLRIRATAKTDGKPTAGAKGDQASGGPQ